MKRREIKRAQGRVGGLGEGVRREVEMFAKKKTKKRREEEEEEEGVYSQVQGGRKAALKRGVNKVRCAVTRTTANQKARLKPSRRHTHTSIHPSVRSSVPPPPPPDTHTHSFFLSPHPSAGQPKPQSNECSAVLNGAAAV